MRRTSRKRVTIADIAKASGVSLSAVSLALSGKPGVSRETRERVVEQARTMGYRMKIPPEPPPNRAMRGIGLLASPDADAEPHAGTFYASIRSAVEAACQQMDLALIHASVQLDGDYRPTHIPPLLERSDVGGLLITGVHVSEEITRALDRRGLPVVLLEAYCPGREYSAILYDNFQGGFDAAAYLISKGHRHIGCVGGHMKDFPSFRERRMGYLKALETYHLAPPYFADFTARAAEPHAVAEAALQLIRQNKETTALVCATDEIAIATMTGLRQAGIGVPGDISVIGFDDIDSAASAVPALTTLRVNRQSMGRMAVQILLNHAIQESNECVVTYFRPTLVERESVCSR